MASRRLQLVVTFTCPRCGDHVLQRYGVYQCTNCQFAPGHESD